MVIEIKNPDDMLGAVNLNSMWRFFHHDFGMWILNYAAYSHHPEAAGERRNGIITVNESSAENYIKVLEKKELTIEQLPHTKHNNHSPMLLAFIVNFDKKLFVDGWADQWTLIDYLSHGWTGMIDDPIKYLPIELQKIWA